MIHGVATCLALVLCTLHSMCRSSLWQVVTAIVYHTVDHHTIYTLDTEPYMDGQALSFKHLSGPVVYFSTPYH